VAAGRTGTERGSKSVFASDLSAFIYMTVGC